MGDNKFGFVSQEPVIIKKDYFSAFDTISEILKAIEIGNKTEEIKIIGLFDAFGEGKSSILKTLKEVVKEDFKDKNYCFIELDLWKYENSELRNEFHKVFHNEKSRFFRSDFYAGLFFSFIDKIPFIENIPIISSMISSFKNKKFIENKITDDYFAYELKRKIRKKNKKENCKKDSSGNESIPIVIIENMDRLTIDEKITALSSIYNYRDSFNSHIIISLDPDSVRGETSYFESLVHKCFTSYMYIPPKTKFTLREYIQDKLLNYETLNSDEINNFTDILITQYPLSLREINHCLNTYIMKLNNADNNELILFMAILQVQYHKLFKAISQNPYILKSFLSSAHDSNFNGYIEYDIKKEQIYKLNLLIKNLDTLDFYCHDTLSILTPLNKEFFKELDSFNLSQSVVYIELLRKANLNKEVIEELEKLTTNWKYEDKALESFLTEIIKDRDTFINFFQSSNYEEIFNIIQRAKTEGNKSIFFQMMLSYSIESIDDYIFYENYVKTVMLFKDLLVDSNYRDMLILRMLENYQLTRTLLEKRIVIELDEFFLTRLKRLSFINKILYTIEVFKILNEDSTTLRTLQNIIVKSIRDIDVEKFNDIERYKQKNIENFYFDEVPRNNDIFITGGLILDIIESSLFERLDSSAKVTFYGKIFDNSKLTNDEYLDSIIQKFSILLNESFLIDDVIIIVEIIEKIQTIDLLGDINELVLKKFICDSLDKFGKYDDDLRDRLERF